MLFWSNDLYFTLYLRIRNTCTWFIQFLYKQIYVYGFFLKCWISHCLMDNHKSYTIWRFIKIIQNLHSQRKIWLIFYKYSEFIIYEKDIKSERVENTNRCSFIFFPATTANWANKREKCRGSTRVCSDSAGWARRREPWDFVRAWAYTGTVGIWKSRIISLWGASASFTKTKGIKTKFEGFHKVWFAP